MTHSPEPAKTAPSPSSQRWRLVALVAAVATITLLAAGAVFWLRPEAPTPVASSGVVQLPKGATIGGPFQLVDHTGRPVSDKDFAGKFMLIYFGFTHCPDVCPTELQTMANVVDALGTDGARVVPVFIAVDPERDTPEQLKGYVAAFHPTLIGLTGSMDQVSAVAKAYKVYFSKAPSGSGGDYQVDHTSFVYLVGPDGAMRSMFRSGISDQAMVAEIRAQLRQPS